MTKKQKIERSLKALNWSFKFSEESTCMFVYDKQAQFYWLELKSNLSGSRTKYSDFMTATAFVEFLERMIRILTLFKDIQGRVINVNHLEGILCCESSVIDGEDVPALMEVIKGAVK